MTERSVMATEYTVGQVADALGITVRTLHHYDRIGLLQPSARSHSGYRLYTDSDLTRLQHIVVYRRLEMPLDEIKTLLESGDATTHLRRQRQAVMDRLDEMNDLVKAIDHALEQTMADQPMSTTEMKELFGDNFHEHRAEAEERWADTAAWQQSSKRTAKYTKRDWEQIKAEGDGLQQHLAELFLAGTTPDSLAAMDAVEQHRQHIERWFYDCPPQLHRCLGELYVSDPRFTASYDETYAAPGLAVWVRDAIGHNADRASV